MDIKSYLKQNKISIRALSDETKVPYSTLNDIVNGKTDIDHVRFGIVRVLSRALSLSVDELGALCDAARPQTEVDGGNIIIKNKRYYLIYHDGEKRREKYLCKVNPLNTRYVTEMAKWDLEELRTERELAQWQKNIS